MDMKKRPFWEEVLPRFLAIGIFVYLVYSLLIRGRELDAANLVLVLIMAALTLAPMARRLKLFNVIDFSSKLNGIEKEQKEAKTELGELRNQISNYIKMNVKPVQKQTTVVSLKGLGEIMGKGLELEEPLIKEEGKELGEGSEFEREQFLLRASTYRRWALTILRIAFYFRHAITERDIFKPERLPKGDSADEQIRYMLKVISADGLKAILPIMLKTESGEIEPLPLDEINKNLQEADRLLDLRQKVMDREIEVPDKTLRDKLFEKIHSGLNDLNAGIIAIGGYSIIAALDMSDRIRALRDELREELDDE